MHGLLNTNQSFAFADGAVTASYGTATAKAHADSLYTSQDNTDGLIPDDNQYYVTEDDLTYLDVHPNKLCKAKLRVDKLIFPIFFEFLMDW